ncbi:MAG TPA: DUF2442 domain-containing protein [Candidatus Ozemobacteraceae bacterium]|nr:DUF2442 domain-containing protein [Candidatus Ozemobacteraceae bacterium]
MNKIHNIQHVRFTNETMQIEIDGKQYEFKLKDISSTLSVATGEQRNAFDVSPSGYGIHWPLVDEDLSIDGLLNISHALPVKKTKAA